MVAGLALCLLYVRRQLKLPEPMLQVGILGTRKYAKSWAQWPPPGCQP